MRLANALCLFVEDAAREEKQKIGSNGLSKPRRGAPVKGQQKPKQLAKKAAQKTLKEKRHEKKAKKKAGSGFDH
jgi:hypothetical protein